MVGYLTGDYCLALTKTKKPTKYHTKTEPVQTGFVYPKPKLQIFPNLSKISAGGNHLSLGQAGIRFSHLFPLPNL